MELTKTEKMYLKQVNRLEASARRGLLSNTEAYDRMIGYDEAIKDNGLNTEKIDCMFHHLAYILVGSPDQKKASSIILKTFTELSK